MKHTILLQTVCAVLIVQAADTAAAQPLQARHAAMAHALSHSPFGRALVLQAANSEAAPQGDVYAVMDHPFDAVSALHKPEHWCALLMLQTNIKRCAPSGERLQVGVARRYTDAPQEAQTVEFRYRVRTASAQELAVELVADEGPVGTRNYSLHFEAVPLGPKQTFIHLSYAYEAGVMARVATSAYLNGAGKDKVGFTVTGRDAQGHPVRTGGIRGVAERNTMRHFLAIESFLACQDVPAPQRAEQRWQRFHAALERYPAQLHETQLNEYLEMKRRESQPRV